MDTSKANEFEMFLLNLLGLVVDLESCWWSLGTAFSNFLEFNVFLFWAILIPFLSRDGSLLVLEGLLKFFKFTF